MQTALNNVHLWCETWGFKPSSDKSVAVMFAQIPPPTPSLLIDSQVVKFQKTARFLSLTFDHQLTRRQHIENVKSACQRRLNLLRAISGKSWGVIMSVLRKVYLALKRSCRNLVVPRITEYWNFFINDLIQYSRNLNIKC